MQGMPRRRRQAALVAAALLFAASAAFGQDPPASRHSAADLNASLRTVINVGADLFNRNADYAGCYHVYQGALISVKPFLPTEFQAKIDVTLARAEQLASDSDRAFELRGMIDEVRTFARQHPTERPVAQKQVERKVEPNQAAAPPVRPVQAVEKKSPAPAAPPVAKAPERKAPEVRVPEKKPAQSRATEPKAPEVKAPEKKTAPAPVVENKAPAKKVAETKAPEKKVAEAKAPEKKAAETKVPERKLVQPKAPERKTPESTKAPEKKEQPKLPEKAVSRINPPAIKPAVQSTQGSIPPRKEATPVRQGPGTVGGVVQFEGRPLPGGFFVTLTSKDGRKYSTLVRQAGAYSFKTPIPAGEYRFNLDPVPGDNAPRVLDVVPARYRDDDTSGLVFHVSQGGNRIELNLVK